MRLTRDQRFNPAKIWRLPAGLCLFGLLVLPVAPAILSLERGTALRAAGAHLLAFAICATMLGVGLGVWTAIRSRRASTLLAAVFSVAVALLWWWLFFVPLIEGDAAVGPARRVPHSDHRPIEETG